MSKRKRWNEEAFEDAFGAAIYERDTATRLDIHPHGSRPSPSVNGLFTPPTSEEALLIDAESLEGTSPGVQDKPTRSPRKVDHAPPEPILQKLVPVIPGPAFPKSLYQAPMGQLEVQAVRMLQEEFVISHLHTKRPEYTFFQLDQFSIYRPPEIAYHGNELVTLDKLTRNRYSEFCFDGWLSFGAKRYKVTNVRFKVMTVDYGAEINKQLCVQSPLAAMKGIWYQLGEPAPEYRRFHKPFLWLVRFTTYFVDYLSTHDKVTLDNFGIDFYKWLKRSEHAQKPGFQSWHTECNSSTDFRARIAVDVEFLWKECNGIQDDEDEIKICEHPIWGEVHPDRLTVIPEQVSKEAFTVVSPFAYDCFEFMYFADRMEVRTIPNDSVRDTVIRRKAELGLTPLREHRSVSKAVPEITQPRSSQNGGLSVSVGDVVVVRADKEVSWKNCVSDLWYAYVQRVWDRGGGTRLDILWLYQPEDTTIGKAFYPYKNELFLSDNCGCGSEEALHVECVVGKVDVKWYATDPESEAGFFARQVFRTVEEVDQYDFIKLDKRHFRCHHQQDHIHEPEPKYEVKDTVLVSKSDHSGTNCEPAQIVSFLTSDEGEDGKTSVWLRKMEFKSKDDSRARPNHLVLTDHLFTRPERDIVRKCNVRFFSPEQIESGDMPTPYDRDGAGDYYILETPDQKDQEQYNLPPPAEGCDPTECPPKKQLEGLGIFCGGGSFDRGLEEGGSVHFRYAVDWAEKALYTYRANVPPADKDSVSFFLGSVNDYLAKAMAGESAGLVAQLGKIDIISGGSPCQGFSRMQLAISSLQSRQNASMVASVISFVDMYVPKYMVLENVTTMTDAIKIDGKEYNVFSQIISALVGLGYQVQQFLIDSWCYGSSQQRSRVFVIASAPGIVPLVQPECTHVPPAHIYRTKILGKCSNGKPFGSRRADFSAALPGVTAQDSTKNLPVIWDSQPQLCPPFPDHITPTHESATIRNRLAFVPKRPYGMGLGKANRLGLVRGEAKDYCSNPNKIKTGPNSKAFSRLYPDRLFGTIMTRMAVGDGIAGRVVHWAEDRVLTIMETRRAQGVPDHEVIVGNPGDRLKITGNAVDRNVALVLGLSLRESWLKSNDLGLDDAVLSGGAEVVMLDDDSSGSDDETDPESVNNRTVKMFLHEHPDRVEAILDGGFRAIRRILQSDEFQEAKLYVQSAVE
jgi:DNA (cytosine-5)-methyltransferase 1